MQFDYKNGGIKMIDATCLLNSIKACWVKQFCIIEKLRVYNNYLQNESGKLVFESEISLKNKHKLCKRNIYMISMLDIALENVKIDELIIGK